MDKVFSNIREFDSSVFKAGKLSARTRNDAVVNQFDRLKGSSFGTNVEGVDYLNSPNDDSRAMFVLLVGLEFADDLGVGGLFAAVRGDNPISYGVEIVGAFYPLQWVVWDFANELAEADKLVCEVLFPVLLKQGLALEKNILGSLYQLGFVDGKFALGDERV